MVQTKNVSRAEMNLYAARLGVPAPVGPRPDLNYFVTGGGPKPEKAARGDIWIDEEGVERMWDGHGWRPRGEHVSSANDEPAIQPTRPAPAAPPAPARRNADVPETAGDAW